MQRLFPGNIQGTFTQRSGNFHGTFREQTLTASADGNSHSSGDAFRRPSDLSDESLVDGTATEETVDDATVEATRNRSHGTTGFAEHISDGLLLL
jgi:hypothetical protein